MDSDTLCEVIAARLEDFAKRYDYLVSIGDYRSAKLLVREGQLIARDHDNDEIFLVVNDLNLNNV